MTDERPAVWVGHVALSVADPARSHDFFVAAGMRTIHRADDFAILELRGGTHLLLFGGEATATGAPFDLMVDDLEMHPRTAIGIDKARLTGVQWQFTVAAGAANSCSVDVTIDNVRFF